ncbi:unnamed protein product [Agarophyton chilense]
MPCPALKIPTLLVVRLNGQATGYDLSSPDRRRYDLRTKDDWHNFRMISFNRRLQRLSLAASSPSLSPKPISTRDKLRAKRAATNTKSKLAKSKLAKSKLVTAKLASNHKQKRPPLTT